MKTAQEIAEQLRTKVLEAEDLKQQKTAVEREMYELKVDLYEAMEEQGVERVHLGGIEFKPMDERDFSLTDEVETTKFDDCPKFFDWLKECRMDGVIKTKRSVHPGTRRSVLKEYVDDGHSLPTFIKETFQQTIKWNKSLVTKMVKEQRGG